MAIPRRATPAPNLGPATIAILLAGWGAESPAPSPHGFEGGFLDLYDIDNSGFVRLWRQHEEYLRTVAAEWNWVPTVRGPDGVLRFYAEHLAAGFPEPGPRGNESF